MADRIPLRRGTVTRVTDFGVFCSISTLGTPQAEFGPMDSGHFDLRVGDRVIVGQAGYETENFVIVTSLTPRPMPITSLYYFETIADRNAIFDGVPAHMLSPTFAWVDDTLTLYVWTDEDNAWHRASWDETRVASIESAATALATRVTNLEGLAVSDTATIDLTLAGSWPKTLSAAVIANSIPINDLSDVVIASPAAANVLRYNGTNFVNSFLNQDDLSDTSVVTPATGQTLRYNGVNFVNTKLATTDLSDVTLTSIAVNQGLLWDGTKFVNANLPLGVIWNHTVNTATTFSSNFNVDTAWYSTSSPAILANRTYKLSSAVVVFTGGGAALKIHMFMNVNGTKVLDSGATPVGADVSEVTLMTYGTWNSGASPGTPTFAAGCGRLQGTQNIDMVARVGTPAQLIIEDLGPARSD